MEPERIGWEDAAMEVRRVRSLRDTAEEELARAVGAMRAAGAPWSHVGEALGVSKQAAQQKYGKTS